ncbi:MAG TPA: amino acid ABC transporter substrate-binding protein [Pseudorhizobium sp.]|nr:amino acid ABC transporter substrate-binding protein [Pseudorhizobium sp.]
MCRIKAISATALLLALAWAGGSAGAARAEAQAQAPVPTLERIRETGHIRIGYGDTAPFSYRLPDGQVVGYSIEICNKLSESLRQQLGLERLDIEYVYRTPRNRIQLLNDGLYDIECNASTNTSERRRSVAFTYSHFYATTRYVALARNNLRTWNDLRGRSVSVALGSINIGEINDLNRDRGLHLSIVPADGLQAAFDLVADGQVSSFAIDDVLLSAMIAQSDNPKDFTLSVEPIAEPKPYGFMIRLGDDEFKQAVNSALALLYRDPSMKQTYSRWFEQAIPGQGINLHQPMSDHLRKVLANPVEETETKKTLSTAQSALAPVVHQTAYD